MNATQKNYGLKREILSNVGTPKAEELVQTFEVCMIFLLLLQSTAHYYPWAPLESLRAAP